MTEGICPFAEWRGPLQPHTFSAGSINRVGFCDHTAGGFYRTLRDPGFWNGRGYSVHFGISREGAICQLVNIFDRAYGQGRLGPVVTWPAYDLMSRVNPNEYLISIEHEDAVTVNGQTRFIPGSEWTTAQYDADLRVKRWCIDEAKRVMNQDLLRFDIDSLAGHHMFDGISRAECPGRFWRNEYRERLFNDLTKQEAHVDENEQIELTLLRTQIDLIRALVAGILICVPSQDGFVEVRRIINGEGVAFDPPIILPVR
jgi:hypothetical protein